MRVPEQIQAEPDPALILRANRVFAARRKAGPPRPGRPPVFHAVTPNCRMALCADEPGAGSDWAGPAGPEVTCPACLRRLARLED